MAKREFVQLAHKYVPGKHSPSGWFMSEKLDGQRVIYDGGITRGMMARDVPWANVEKDKKTMFATGLWTRGGKTVQAPGWWIDSLPKVPLDGELYAGRGKFQLVESVVRDHQPGPEWPKIKFMVFDSPPLENWLVDGKIDTPRFQKSIKGALGWAMRRISPQQCCPPNMVFESRLKWLAARIPSENEYCKLHEQERLPFKTTDAVARLGQYTAEICEDNGEGVVLKNPSQYWLPERTHAVLKVKPWDDAEATVIGYRWGRDTDKGGKLVGLMGSIWLQNEKGKFKCSGFTDLERGMTFVATGESAFSVGCAQEDTDVAEDIHNPRFPRGSEITYRFRELTDSGLPKEARYHRVSSGD